MLVKTDNWNLNSGTVYAKIDVLLDKRVELSGQVSPIEMNIKPSYNPSRFVGGARNGFSFPGQELKKIRFKSKPSMPNFGVREDDPDEPEPIKIGFNVTFHLRTCASKSKIQCPMFDQNLHKAEFLSKRIDLKTGCQNKDLCKCNLQFHKVSNESAQIHIGTKTHLDLEFRASG